jgi:hypothetical protein
VNMARHPHMRGSDFHANNELAGCLHLRSGAFLAGHSPRVGPRPLRPLKPAPAQKQQIADSPASRASPPKQLLRPVLRPPPAPSEPGAGFRGWQRGDWRLARQKCQDCSRRSQNTTSGARSDRRVRRSLANSPAAPRQAAWRGTSTS